MIRRERFTLTTDTFASQRREVLERSDARLLDVVKTGLQRLGLNRWKDPIVTRALEVFDSTAALEMDEPNQVYDDMRKEFERELRGALEKTKTSKNLQAQTETITRWLSTYAVNAGTEAAIVSDTGDDELGLEWVTMSDNEVRESHVDAGGQIVPVGEPFSVAGEELLYPGQPVGDPSVWINCRCVARPTLLEQGFTANFKTKRQTSDALTAAGEDDPKNTSSIVAVLPAADDPVNKVSSEDGAHVTLLWLGDAADFDPSDIKLSLESYAATFGPGPFTEPVSGTATLGADEADVVLLDAVNLAPIRAALLEDQHVRARHDQVQQYPTWLPHLTLGYPDAPRRGDMKTDGITFDRIALWHGDEKFEYPLKPKAEEAPEDTPEEPVEGEFAVREDLEEDLVEEAEDGTTPPPIDQAESEVAVPWHALLAPEGVPTGDKRMFALNSLSNRDLPVPLKFMPADAEGHDGSYVVGRIDKIWKNETGEFWAEGVFDFSPQAYEAVRMIAEEMQTGISVDVDAVEGQLNEDGEEEYTSARISGATQCAIPAFAESKIFLGPYQEIEAEDTETVPLEPEQEASVRRLTQLNLSPEFRSKFLPGLRDSFVSEESWDGSASRFTDEQWHKSCILHLHSGAPTSKSECKLPIREPGGALSRAGVHAAAGRISQVDAPPEAIAKAKASLRSAYKELGEEVPDNLTAAAVPGLKEDGTPPKCAYCEETATQYVLHSEGMAYVPACDEHIEQAKTDAAASVPGGEPDPSNIVRVAEYAAGIETFDIPPRKTKDGPGWITEPKPTKRITAYWVDGPGAAKIGWGAPGDFNRCRLQLAKYVQNPDWLAGLCANLHYRALGAWPGQASGRTQKMSSLVAAAGKPLPSEWFKDPQLEGPTPFTVTPDGRVFGHIATWDTCHIGFSEKCETPQPSATNYAYFLTGEVDTDAGPVAVGQVTMGGGHASLKAGLRAAAAHYDSTSTAVADIAVGDDAYGVWCSGALRPGLADEDVHALRASGSLSGDWRGVRVGSTYSREMIAALAVNVPGFPIPRTQFARNRHETTALVAAGIVTDGRVSDDEIDQRVEAVLARRERMALAENAKRTVRTFRAKQIKATIKH